MKREKEIQDDEIRVIGSQPKPRHRAVWQKILIAVAVLAGVAAGIYAISSEPIPEVAEEEVGYFEQETVPEVPTEEVTPLGTSSEEVGEGFCELRDTLINDIPLRIYIPHRARPTLHVGHLSRTDSTIVLCAQAADIRRDNRKIVGAFVLRGEPLAWGLSKKGFCAIIGDRVTIGKADNSPLFEQATEEGGYFFRQYPLVDRGRLVENKPKNKALRRALCDRRGELFVVDCSTRESFHDFAQALVDLGVDHAIYLVGCSAYGWARGEDGAVTEFGEYNARLPKNTSYIVWRK